MSTSVHRFISMLHIMRLNDPVLEQATNAQVLDTFTRRYGVLIPNELALLCLMYGCVSTRAIGPLMRGLRLLAIGLHMLPLNGNGLIHGMPQISDYDLITLFREQLDLRDRLRCLVKSADQNAFCARVLAAFAGAAHIDSENLSERTELQNAAIAYYPEYGALRSDELHDLLHPGRPLPHQSSAPSTVSVTQRSAEACPVCSYYTFEKQTPAEYMQWLMSFGAITPDAFPLPTLWLSPGFVGEVTVPSDVNSVLQ